jgi:hypothetical protein
MGLSVLRLGMRVRAAPNPRGGCHYLMQSFEFRVFGFQVLVVEVGTYE